ncbi:MAG: response regulator [Rhizobiaceae bacterium]
MGKGHLMHACQATGQVAGPTVLIVDDNPVFRTLLEEVLYDSGSCKVIPASDGIAGLQILNQQAEHIDVVTLDLSMPNCDGVEFLRHLSESGFGGRLVLISGEHENVRNSAGSLASMLGLNCIAIFKKPVDFREIAACLLNPPQLDPSRMIHPK